MNGPVNGFKFPIHNFFERFSSMSGFFKRPPECALKVIQMVFYDPKLLKVYAGVLKSSVCNESKPFILNLQNCLHNHIM